MSDLNGRSHPDLSPGVFAQFRHGDAAPDVSIVIPVNAQGDLENVRRLLSDLAAYHGKHTFEAILVVNNYPEGQTPAEADELRALGVEVLCIPNVRRPGEAVGFSARIPGIRAARADVAVVFDADNRIPNFAALLDWYVEQFRQGAQAAYTHAVYYDVDPSLSVRTFVLIHHAARWFKRAVLGIAITRGCNYAVNRSLMLQFYDEGLLADEMNVGPTFQRKGHRVAYSGARRLTVTTSGRMFTPGWRKMIAYYWYRLRYNLRVLPGGKGVAARTGRENDPVRRYIDNKPVTVEKPMIVESSGR